MGTKVQVSYRTHNRTLFSCSSLDDLMDEDKWSEVAFEEGWGQAVEVKTETGDNICDCVADRWGGINLELDFYIDDIKALKEKFLILKDECWGGADSVEGEDGDDGDGLYEVKDINFKPSTVRLGLIEDIKNDAGDIISTGGYTGLKYDWPEEYTYYYEIKNGELVQIEYDKENNSWKAT